MSRPQKPNLLFIWTDQQRKDTLACYGNQVVRTPHLNRLADRSFVFENCYCTQPVCTPSRGSIMTGLFPHTHGAINNNVPLGNDSPTIAQMLGDDYRKAYFGKWHLGDEIFAQRGFKEWKSIEDAYRGFFTDKNREEQYSDYHYYLLENGFVPDGRAESGPVNFSRGFAAALAEPYTKAGYLGQEASRFISEQTGDQPWMLSVNFLEPHPPFFGPLNNEYDPDEIDFGPAFRKYPEGGSMRNRFFADKVAKRFGGFPLETDDQWRRLKANYYGLVTMVDNSVGRILTALEQSGQADNTIVVFTSDHGEMMGDHAQLCKSVFYEQSVTVPLLMHVPWLSQEQQRVPGRFSQIDLVPTFLDLLNQSQPDHLQGQSRLPVLKGEQTLAGNHVVVEWNAAQARSQTPELSGYTQEQIENLRGQQWRSIVTANNWKLNLCMTDKCELFDLNDDPYELVNRIDDSRCAPRIRNMTGMLQDWQARTDDTLSVQLAPD